RNRVAADRFPAAAPVACPARTRRSHSREASRRPASMQTHIAWLASVLLTDREEPTHLSARRARRPAPTRMFEWKSDRGGRRSAGGARGEENAVRRQLDRYRAPRVSERGSAGSGVRVGIGAEDARAARGAVLGRLQMAEQVVMSELRDEQKQRIERDTGEGPGSD